VAHAQSTIRINEIDGALEFSTIGRRIFGMLTFQRGTVLAVASDQRATLQAALIVFGTGIATSVGLKSDIFGSVVAVLLGWIILSTIVWVVADRFLNAPTGNQPLTPLLRTIGFAQAPTALIFLNFVWVLGPLLAGAGALWSLAVTVFAIRHTTHFGYPRSVLLTIAGSITTSVVGVITSAVFNIQPSIW
jgi:hypothetical protein